MAVRRSIHAKISLSESVEAMSEWAQLLWDRVFVHADDFGRLEASPAKVKARCKPMSPRPLEDFAEAIAEMAAVGMVAIYENSGRFYIQISTFDLHQSVPKRTASKWPTLAESQQLSADEYLRNFQETAEKLVLAHAGGSEREKEKEREKSSTSLSDSVPEPDVTVSKLEDLTVLAIGSYNGLAGKWGKPKISPKRAKKLARRIAECDKAMRDQDPDFSFDRLLARVEQQADFFRQRWQAWDLEWFIETTRGEFIHALRTWSFAYAQGDRSPPRSSHQSPAAANRGTYDEFKPPGD